MKDKKLPLPIAIAWIVGSTLICSGSVFSLHKWLACKSWQHKMQPPVVINKIIQTGPQRDRLSSLYIEDLLHLSVDHPTHYKDFDCKQATTCLLQVPMIKTAHVELIGKDTVYVDYLLRNPIAKVYDYENVGCDEEGYLFPLAPFYSPKELPEIYFGQTIPVIESFSQLLTSPAFELALSIIKSLDPIAKEDNFRIKRIDVSSAFLESLGRQEIVIDIQELKLGFQEEVFPRYIHRLRLSPKDYPKQLGNYLNLHKELTSYSVDTIEDPGELKVIDLRIQGVAYIPK